MASPSSPRKRPTRGCVIRKTGCQVPAQSSVPADKREKRARSIRQAAGDRFEALELSTMVFAVVVTDHRQREAEELARSFGMTGDQLLDSIQFLVGTVDQMTEEIQMWRERFGISYITVVQKYRDALAPVVARLAGT